MPAEATLTLGPVWPSDQFTVQPEQMSLTVSTTDWPGQSAVVPEAVMAGAAGEAAAAVTATALEAGLFPQKLLSVAV